MKYYLKGDDLVKPGIFRLRIKDKDWLYMFLAPAVCALLLLTIFPLIYGVRNTFYGWDLIKPGSQDVFVGLKNYADVLGSQAFWSSLVVTFKFSIFSVAGAIVVGMAMALIFFYNLPGNLVVRALVLSAMVITPIIVGTSFKLMLNPEWGLLSRTLDAIGIQNDGFLANTKFVLPALICIDIWQWSPLVMIIILSALNGLPVEIYETAKVDGASSFQVFTRITLPLLKPSIMLAVLIRTMDSLRSFDIIFASTMGGPGTASQNLNLLMYNVGFEFFQISKASTMAVLLLIIITVISNIIIKVFGGGNMDR